MKSMKVMKFLILDARSSRACRDGRWHGGHDKSGRCWVGKVPTTGKSTWRCHPNSMAW
ncbi:MAG: hypothetical protein JXD22_08620 [Sedimentisphaerales bacterium]|nr:hypothetical protein [Sedimentisphaerales bacterium]